MSERIVERRVRRRARLRCALEHDGKRLSGLIQNISVEGVGVEIAEPIRTPLRPEAVIDLELHLPDETRPAHARCQVAWVEADARDASGQQVVSAGLTFVDPDRELRRRLETFVSGFRYLIAAVDDEPVNVDLIKRVLENDYRVVTCLGAAEALELLAREEVAVMVCDQVMPQMSGLGLVMEIERRWPLAPLQKVVLTAHSDFDDLREFVNRGRIHHYMLKPFDVGDMRTAIAQAVERYAMVVENQRLQDELERANRQLQRENAALRRRVATMPTHGIIGDSPTLRRVLESARQVAATDTTVLIRGETGTGKELLARTLHQMSLRFDKPFVAVNCAALSESLVESELFGHERGAFTGAATRRIGRLESADGGTLLIDEVGDLPVSVQVKLLRVLQEGTFERVGSNDTIACDVRIIAATHRNLEELIARGQFREDLYYRLAVVPIVLPPLRERPDDVWPLALHYLEQFQQEMHKEGIQIPERMRTALMEHNWPGNVRELMNVMARIVALTPSGGVADATDLRARGPSAPPAPAVDEPLQGSLKEMVDRYEKRLIERALAGTSGNRSAAARQLGMSRQALAVKLAKHAIS